VACAVVGRVRPLRRIAHRLDGFHSHLSSRRTAAVLSAKELDAAWRGARWHDSLHTLDAARTATMEAAVGGSYHSLTSDAAKLLRWLSSSPSVDLSTVECLFAGSAAPLTVLVDKFCTSRAGQRLVYRMLHRFAPTAAAR